MLIGLKRGDSPTATVVHLGSTSLLFSYETIVAFSTRRSGGWICSENIWSNTTGKHMNQETRVAAADRMPHAEFLTELYKVLDSL